MIKKKLHNLTADILAWWAEPAPQSVIRWFNVGVGGFILIQLLMWFPHAQNLFTSEGYSTAEFVREVTLTSEWSLLFLNDSLWFVYLLFGIAALGCLSLIFNVVPRVGHVIAYVAYLSFTSRYPLLHYGAVDVFLFLSFWSIFFGYNTFLDSWARRMLQIHMAIVYLFAGLTKALSSSWMNGSELYSVLQTRFSVIDITHWRVPELVVNAFTVGTALLELAFIFLVWQPKWRRVMVISMAGLHVGIFFLMNASYFSEVMLLGLLMFVTKEDVAVLTSWWKGAERSLVKRFPVLGDQKK